jgi:uncharacterized protein (DUF2062 family)
VSTDESLQPPNPLTPIAVEEEAAVTAPTAGSRWWQLRSRLRDKWEELKAENATPEKLGLAFGVGVALAFSPFHGFQVLLGFLTAWIFRLNKIALFIGLNVTIPPVLPLVILSDIQLGALILHQRLLPLSVAQIREMSGDHLFRELFLNLFAGGMVLGPLMGVISGYLATRFIRRQRARKAAVTAV